jgi:thiol-disulfide isomerase/thioredoxin
VLISGVSPGLVALIAALAVALLAGAGWRLFNGRMRRVLKPDARAAVAKDTVTAGNGAHPLAVSGTDSGSGTSRTGTRSRLGDGSEAAGAGEEPAAGQVLTSEQLGAELGDRATLVQFSSAFCAPCRATRRVLVDVAGMVDGVVHVEVDAESRLDLVRELNVLRTPTVLVLDADGRIVSRGSGQARKADVIAVLADELGVLTPGT